ncbi:unnamed protein product [Didymodactylos carnosus]|uniref:SURP motif domain-containing protein n=1 Tax=Didymodactylos carnosus TaxID=1234261 RepID=A0A8S2DKZ3_9BILA|nr:unnamed protein product [Didymodactylos carnosus]CAF3726413.1 unnamed protein product [Didymodactylos carnosus]
MTANINLFAEFEEQQENDSNGINSRPNSYDSSNHHQEDEIIVFGYSCKLFRDDHTAKAIDRGQNLIPWNGDETIKIDRYDCRGHLFDLVPWDADLLRTENKLSSLSDEENQIEKLCDEERYLSLHRDLDHETLYQEEEWKRFCSEQNLYGQVGFSYKDDTSTQEYKQPSLSTDQHLNEQRQQQIENDEYEPFYPSDKLQLPYGMEIPESIKLNAVIEKTAVFVASHGLQMEIVLKTKQAKNSQFDFLKYDNYLNPYYRHLIMMIKSGKYRPDIDNTDNNTKTKKKIGIKHEENDDDDEESSSYLHPLLRGSSKKSITTTTDDPKTPLPLNIHDTAYGQLIKNFEHLRQRERALKGKDDDGSITSDDSTAKEPSSFTDITLSANVIPPPPDMKPVVDKLAEYVARNGSTFERSIRTKNDQRFAFVEKDHVHYNYYQFKVQLCLQEIRRAKYEEEKRRLELEEQNRVHGRGVKLVLKIKQNDDNNSKPSSSSSVEFQHTIDEDEITNIDKQDYCEENSNGSSIDKNIEKQSEKHEQDMNNSIHKSSTWPLLNGDQNYSLDSEEKIKEEFPLIGPQPASPMELERIRQQHIELERKKDRLNLFVRDKLVQESKEKQEERKKKAEMFIQLIKSKNPNLELPNTNTDNANTIENKTTTTTINQINPVIVEKLLNVKNQSPISASTSSTTNSYYKSNSRSSHRFSKRSRSKSPRASTKYHQHHSSSSYRSSISKRPRRSRSKSSSRHRRRSSSRTTKSSTTKRSRSRSKSKKNKKSKKSSKKSKSKHRHSSSSSDRKSNEKNKSETKSRKFLEETTVANEIIKQTDAMVTSSGSSISNTSGSSFVSIIPSLSKDSSIVTDILESNRLSSAITMTMPSLTENTTEVR